MDQVYEILIHKVRDYGGTVNEMTGDGVMGLFGAPIALEDAPQRAIRSAMAIHRAMARFNENKEIELQGLMTLKMRAGIHTGPVVVGTLGNDLRVEFKAVGDTVNLASRMEGMAEAGTTYVTEDTFKLTEGFFRFEALGKRDVKGKKAPVRVYRAIATSSRRTRFDVSAERGLTPFIGRDRELDLFLDAFNRAKSGKGQVFSIMAEAGLGKSRLLYEFRKTVASEDVTILEGKCLSYSRGVAYHPIIDVLKSNFDIHDADSDSEIIEKVKENLKIINVDKTSTLPYLLELLSIKESGIDKISMSPEARKVRIAEAVERITLKGSEIRPLILVIEDLHWIDNNSAACFKNLLEHISGANILLVFTYRPEFVHSWGGRSYYNQVNLTRLSNRESNEIVNCILETSKINSKLKKLILDKTEGVPFFIEEFIRSLKDLKLLILKNDEYYLSNEINNVSVPSTIQDIIMARVDSLPEGAKEVLQTGSVIEREFSYDLIKLVMGLSEKELLTHLSVLRDSELIYQRGIYPESTYIFKHALTQAVVFGSILSRRKKKLHNEIGKAIEKLFKDNISEYYGVLVKHFIESDNCEKAAEYSRLAGIRSESSASFPDAIAYAKKRIACLEKLPATKDTQRKIISARTKLGYYYIRMDYFADAKKSIDPIVDLARNYNYKNKLSEIISIIGIYEWSVEENFSQSVTYLKEALKISRQVDDISLSRFPNYWLGVALSFMCEFEESLYHFEKALEVAVDKKTLWDISVVKSCLSYFVYTQQGDINIAYQLCNKALQIAEETGDVFPKAFAYTNYGVACYTKGLFKEAITNLLKGVDFCKKIDIYTWNAFTHLNMGEFYFDIGEYEKSKQQYAKSILMMKKNKTMPSWIRINNICLAKAKIMTNNKDIDIEALYKYDAENRIELYSGLIKRSIGEILLNIDNEHFDDAEIWIKRAIKTDNRNGMMWHLGKDYALYSELWRHKGRQSKARESLIKAIEIFKKCGADGWVQKYEHVLSSLDISISQNIK
jgi:tetratricopeptide (TPR) repeat protein